MPTQKFITLTIYHTLWSAVSLKGNTHWKGMNPLIPLIIGQIVPLLFYKNGFGIR